MTFVDEVATEALRMVTESGDLVDFDADVWANSWVNMPNPALGGKKPIEFVTDEATRKKAIQILRMIQSGTYA